MRRCLMGRREMLSGRVDVRGATVELSTAVSAQSGPMRFVQRALLYTWSVVGQFHFMAMGCCIFCLFLVCVGMFHISCPSV